MMIFFVIVVIFLLGINKWLNVIVKSNRFIFKPLITFFVIILHYVVLVVIALLLLPHFFILHLRDIYSFCKIKPFLMAKNVKEIKNNG